MVNARRAQRISLTKVDCKELTLTRNVKLCMSNVPNSNSNSYFSGAAESRTMPNNSNPRHFPTSGSKKMSCSSSSSLDETLANLTLALKLKQQQLEEREHQLQMATEQLERDRSQLFAEAVKNNHDADACTNNTDGISSHSIKKKCSGSDVIHLNVGGTHVAVLRRTLTSVEGSMLASRFSGRWDDSLERDKDGNFFIDQPIELFLPMINYLRAKASETPLGPPVRHHHITNYEIRQDYYRMVEYFGCTPGIFPCAIELHRGEPGSAEIYDFPSFAVTAKEWLTFTVQTQGHVREIISYEVVLGNVERFQIGWIDESKYVENLSNDHKNGVGEEIFSIALDCCRGGLLNQGEFTKLIGLSIGAGSVIRCEQKGHRWIVNGELVLSSRKSDDNTMHFANSFLPQFGHVNRRDDDKIIPCFSGKGHWRITQLVLSNP